MSNPSPLEYCIPLIHSVYFPLSYVTYFWAWAGLLNESPKVNVNIKYIYLYNIILYKKIDFFMMKKMVFKPAYDTIPGINPNYPSV